MLAGILGYREEEVVCQLETHSELVAVASKFKTTLVYSNQRINTYLN